MKHISEEHKKYLDRVLEVCPTIEDFENLVALATATSDSLIFNTLLPPIIFSSLKH